MPRQNRVNPFGELIATNARGLFMGNRGVLHDKHGELTSKRWTHQHWIICLPEYKNRKRSLMAPGCYTELFFMDEAVAMAAGHRPCAECRRERFNQFKAAWIKGNPEHIPNGKVSVNDIDKILHRERVDRSKSKVTYQAGLFELPSGAFFSVTDNSYLWWDGRAYLWQPEGYQGSLTFPQSELVTVLTPRSLVNAIISGYIPQCF